MSGKSKIEWTDRTWNPVLGCKRVGAGCDNCYAIRQAHMRAANPNEAIAAAFAGLTARVDGRLDWTGTVRFLPGRLHQPLALAAPSMWFVNSLADLFYGTTDDDVAQVFAVMASAQRHIFQIATKRPVRARALLSSRSFRELVAEHVARLLPVGRPDARVNPREVWPLPNVWLGVSVEDQRWADLRIPVLLDTPAAIRWISAEPLLGPVKLRWNWLWPRAERCGFCRPCAADDGRVCEQLTPTGSWLDWVVAGGESGPEARPMHPDWPRSLRDQCQLAKVPFHFKQRGEWTWTPQLDWPVGDAWRRPQRHRYVLPGGQSRPFGDFAGGADDDGAVFVYRVGKTAAGRDLDGATWNQYPAGHR